MASPGRPLAVTQGPIDVHRPIIRRRAVPELPERLHHNEIMHRVLAARGLTSGQELSLSLSGIPRPDTLPGIDRAVERLLQARDSQQRVVIVGDYDCDGATSSAVALLGLGMLGFTRLEYMIPNRFKHGYGLSTEIVDVAHQEYQAQLILTVDNGVASVDGVERARRQGIDVIVTDHHLAPERLPEACAIVNPSLSSSTFSGRYLAGVGVIFYTLLALRTRLKALGDSRAQAPLQNLLDLVAIGTVADVVPLDALNRILVEQGLRRIRQGRTLPGVLALLDVAGCDFRSVTTRDIGFGIGPRLNAAGRLDDMRIGVQCLLSDATDTAQQLARQLNQFNQERQNIERAMRDSASVQLQKLPLDRTDTQDEFVVCLKDDDWHPGVAGILAGRLKESHYKPAVVFTREDSEHLRGSVRSIPGVHIRDVLQSIAASHPGMVIKFGGHAMAAGLTLSSARFDQFREAFNDAVRVILDGKPGIREHLTDGALAAGELTLDNAQLLAVAMPWGQGFEAPLFDNTFQLLAQRVVGDRHLKLQLKPLDADVTIDAIAFNQAPLTPAPECLHAVYSLEANTFRDQCSVQLRVQYLEPFALR